MEVNDKEVLRLLSALRECSRQVERGVREHALDEVDVGILVLAESSDGGLRPSQAAEVLEVPPPSVTRHVQALHRAGLLVIDPDAEDRRGYRIAISPAGMTMLGSFRADLVARFAPVLQGWTHAEVTALADGLTRLGSSMAAARTERTRRGGTQSWWRDHA